MKISLILNVHKRFHLIEFSRTYESSRIYLFMSFKFLLDDLDFSFEFLNKTRNFTSFKYVSIFNHILLSSKYT